MSTKPSEDPLPSPDVVSASMMKGGGGGLSRMPLYLRGAARSFRTVA